MVAAFAFLYLLKTSKIRDFLTFLRGYGNGTFSEMGYLDQLCPLL